MPTPHDVVERLLDLAEVTSRDVVYDLGCGDGRILVAAARRHGARGLGVDAEPHWVEESRRNAAAAGVEPLVRFELRDALTVDLSEATVIALYLVPWSMQRLAPRIASQAPAGARVVSHSFPIEGWMPDRVESFVDAGGARRTLYLWRLPAA